MEKIPLNTVPSSDMMKTVMRADKQHQDVILSQEISRKRGAILRKGRESNVHPAVAVDQN
jgi:hypothetical protein